MKKLPPIIYTEKPDLRYPHIYVYSESFFRMVEKLKLEYLFSAVSPQKRNSDFTFFFVKDGYMIIMSLRDRSNIEDIDIDIGDFTSFDQFLEANYYGIPNLVEFTQFQASGFRDTLTKKDYLNYVEASRKGFPSKSSFEHAKQLGIESSEEYQKFQKAGVGYEEYKKMVAGGFTDKKEYRAAIQLGITTQKAYLEYNAHRFDPYLKKVKEIKNDADSAYNKKSFSEFVRLEYLMAEKLGETIYYKLFNKPVDNQEEVNLTEIIAGIENKIARELNLIDELNFWRLKRNDIVHEHLKIEEFLADKSKKFFIRLYETLMDIFNEF